MSLFEDTLIIDADLSADISTIEEEVLNDCWVF